MVRFLKSVVIREEFVALTGDTYKAVVLNQLIYWAQRTQDYDKFILEEQKRNPDCNVGLQHGWIYKKSQELVEETMLQISAVTMRRIIKGLVERGWVDERTNLENMWDKCLQYRPNLIRIQQDLHAQGFPLSGFTLAQTDHGGGETQGGCSNLQTEASCFSFRSSSLQTEASELQKSSFIYRTEITPEITTKTDDLYVERISRESVVEELIKIWNKSLGESLPCNPQGERQSRLFNVFKEVFQEDLGLWQLFCEQIATTPFLRGSGPNQWKASLDWCLDKDRIHRILEGQYAVWSKQEVIHKPSADICPPLDLSDLQAEIAGEQDRATREFKQNLLKVAGPHRYHRWFGELTIASIDAQLLVLNAPNDFIRNMCTQKFHMDLLKAAEYTFTGIRVVEVQVSTKAVPYILQGGLYSTQQASLAKDFS